MFGDGWSRPQLAECALHSLGRHLRSQTHRNQFSPVNKPLPFLGQQLADSQLPQHAPVGDHPHQQTQQRIPSAKIFGHQRTDAAGAPRCACTVNTGEGCHCRGPPSPARETSLVEIWALCGGSFGLFFLSLLVCLFFFFRSPVRVCPLIVQRGNRVRLSCSPACPRRCDVMS